MSVLTAKLAIRQHCAAERYAEAVRRVEAEAIAGDPDGGRFCRYCGLAQHAWRDAPMHAEDCPVTILQQGR